jgi:uncharacterized membrane protein
MAFDFFLLVMIALLPVMGFAILQARRGNLRLHATLMTCSFVLFVIALVDFEWAARTMDDPPPLPGLVLAIHLCFAIPALVLWIYQLVRARRAHLNPRQHARLGRLIFALLVATVGTGAWVYWAMFS